MRTITPLKCPNCNKSKFNFVIDKYEDGTEQPLIYCVSCKKTFVIIVGEEV
jgi:transposase-like protein